MRTKISLNGTWELEGTHDESLPSSWNHTVPVPALVDAAIPSYDWNKYCFHWHRTKFNVPNTSELTFILIEQAMFGTEVWLNGKHLGGDIACYTSQEYDASGAMRIGAENELVARVGAKSALPRESAVGNDQERTGFIPGIWGDVGLILCGNPRVKVVQVIPHIDRGEAEARVTIENLRTNGVECDVAARVVERLTKKQVSEILTQHVSVQQKTEAALLFPLRIGGLRLWSVNDPFLYELETTVSVDGKLVDSHRTTFGMREFSVVGSDFFFNGKRMFLKGGNIAFHRFLSDKDRGTLPWDADWIKKALIDVPRAHNFNFFRSHLGQMYNRWYDIADEHGILIQNEWPFWTVSGTKEQITHELSRWVRDNWNHPSIIIWDALNECSYPIVQKEIVPEMKKLDPTRPWESVDFIEQHPYIYSLGPVLNDSKLGFAESLDDIEHSPEPSVVNEFLWWWIDRNGEPTTLTREVVERWLGKDYGRDELLDRQSFLAQELVELLRRMRVDAIQPFVYISNDAGPTANWFTGNIKDLMPKPILKTLKNAFAPLGLSVELWDRHFITGEIRTVRAFVFNDHTEHHSGIIRYGVTTLNGDWLSDSSLSVSVDAGGCSVIPLEISIPHESGEYRIRGELRMGRGNEVLASSEKIAHVFRPLEPSLDGVRVALIGSDEMGEFLRRQGCAVNTNADLTHVNALVVGEGMLNSDAYQHHLAKVSEFVKNGGTLVVIEPEYGLEGKLQIPVLNGVSVLTERRKDLDKGGYDSYVFPEDYSHPLWKGLEKKHLQMFNGAFGGEVVSQHNVTLDVPDRVLSRCGLKLGVVAGCEASYGKGHAIVSRLQVRGRLARGNISQSLYARRIDPVLQQYFINLMRYACDAD